MYDRGKVIIGLVIFVVLATFPILYNMGRATAKPDPKIDTPVINKMEDKKCVEPKDFMRAEHMKLLDQWRDWAVRDAKRVYVGHNDKVYDVSLQNTCMNCHSNKKKFCDECHTYMAVKPYCWDCHFIKEEKGS